MRQPRRYRRPTGSGTASRSPQAGAALLEFALVAPLFLAIIYGIRGIVTLSRARYELAVVSHAVMREAAAGVTEETTLTALANGYAKFMGLRLTDRLVVTLEPAGMPSAAVVATPGPIRSLLANGVPGVRIRVSSLVPAGAILPGRWTRGFPMQCSSVCVIGSWKSPMAMLKKAVTVPDPDTGGH